jgi:oxygen-independent coproporphyrinogen III oxidase
LVKNDCTSLPTFVRRDFDFWVEKRLVYADFVGTISVVFSTLQHFNPSTSTALLYLHIPFCKQACHYCDFHFSTSLRQKGALVMALIREMELRSEYLSDRVLSSVYFGGGTPSLLDEQELAAIFKAIEQHFQLAPGAEITLEANPDDLSIEKLKSLRDSPINRLSIGIQSFADADLQFMNRAHQASEARHCIENALKMGFDDFSIDLIYGSPTTSDAQWLENLRIAFDYPLPHLSAYCLTVEPRTALAHQVKIGKALPVDENQATRQFKTLMEEAEKAGFEHYEISNFAKTNRYARHNTNYWRGKPYLGLGPSAHSFDGRSRQWNLANNAGYVKILENAQVENLPQSGLYEIETLSPSQRYNEQVMTSLRTQWGLDLEAVEASFQAHFLESAQAFLASGQLIREGQIFRLSREGRFLADHIASELFYLE